MKTQNYQLFPRMAFRRYASVMHSFTLKGFESCSLAGRVLSITWWGNMVRNSLDPITTVSCLTRYILQLGKPGSFTVEQLDMYILAKSTLGLSVILLNISQKVNGDPNIDAMIERVNFLLCRKDSELLTWIM